MNTDLSEQERKSYEQYLLASTEEEKEEAIKKLIPGTLPYYYLYFLDALKKNGSKLSEQDWSMLQQFEQKYPQEQKKKSIKARLLFLKYDAAETEEQKLVIIEEIKSHFSHQLFNHYKPEDFGRQSDSLSSQSEDEDEVQTQSTPGEFALGTAPPIGLFGFGTVPTSLNIKPLKKNNFHYEKAFSKAKILEQLKRPQFSNNYVAESNAILEKLPKGYEQDLNFLDYHPQSVYNWAITHGDVISDLDNASFFESIKLYLEQAPKYSLIDKRLCNVLTLKQLDKLSSIYSLIKEDKNYIGAYFQKQFNDELSVENQEYWGLEEKRANLERLYQYAKGKDMPKSLQSSLLIEILEIGVKIGVFSENYFRDYLKIPLVTTNFKEKQNRHAQADAHWNSYLNSVQSQLQRNNQWDVGQSEVVEKYLEKFCHEKGSLESFSEDFDAEFLKNIEEKIQIYNSDDMTGLNIDLKKYQSNYEEVQLRFIESNREFYRVDEGVSLTLEIKNIPTLYAKIFEFNTETYYKKTLQPFNTAVNLDGLVASGEKVYEYKYPANKKVIETFDFPELAGKIGLFIVEFIGNGMSARAVIKKGSLSFIHKPTIAGHLAYILDENKRICKGSNTGIYFDGQYYKAEEGKIFIPYGKQVLTSKVILMNNGFAQLSDFSRQTEDYEFKALVAINPESILIGKKAQFMIRPVLKINGRQAGVELLKNSVVTLTTTSYIDNLPVTKKFEDLKFKNNQELILDFQVPPYLDSINVVLETEVKNITKNKIDKFVETQNFAISTHKNSTNMSQIYLRKEGKNHLIYVLGKNGEPKANVGVDVSLICVKYMKVLPSVNEHLTTNKDGRVLLGQVKYQSMVQVNVPLFNISATYFINPQKQLLNYQDTFDTIENEDLEFPVLFSNLTRKKVSFLKVNGDNVLEDLFDQVIFEKGEHGLNKIVIKALGVGEYDLDIKSVDQAVHITVHRGNQWESDNFILKKNCLFENRVAHKIIKIEDVKIEEGKSQDSRTVSIQLKDFSDHARVHICAFQFQPEAAEQTYCEMTAILQDKFSKTVFPFANWKNIFLSNKELGDEFRYVFDRKYAERATGNIQRNRSIGAYSQEKLSYSTLLNKLAGKKNQILEFQNFLKHSPLNLFNLRPDKNGLITFNADLQPYTQLIVIALDFNSVAQRNIDLPINQILKRDLSLAVSLDQSKGFTESRTIITLPKGEPHGIEDITSTEIQLVDDLIKVKTVLEVLMSSVHISNSTFKELDFVLKWHTFDSEEKNKKFSKFTSHELNTFLYFKDKEYFKTIVKPFLECKMEKTFIDYYLLGYYDKVIAQKSLSGLAKLNALEQCFLIDALVKKEQVKEAEKVLESMKLRCDQVENREINHVNRMFDIILNLNMLKTQEPSSTYPSSDDPFSNLMGAPPATTTNMDNLDFGGFGGMESVNINSNANVFGDYAAHNRLPSAGLSAVSGGGGFFGSAMNNVQPRMLQLHQQQIQQPMYQQIQAQPYQQQMYQNIQPSAQLFSQNIQPASYSTNNYTPQMDVFDDMSWGGAQAVKVQEQLMQKRKDQRMPFEEVEQTNEYTETHYYKQKHYSSFTNLAGINSFWIDYATHLIHNQGKNFLSSNFWRNYDYQLSSTLTLALLDLPFDPVQHDFKSTGRAVELTPHSSLILCKKEVKEAPLDLKNEIMTTHRYVQQDQNQGFQNEEDSIPSEFLSNKVYQCEIILTNASPQRKEVALLYQIPQGSMPLQMTKYMKSIPKSLQPYSTRRFAFQFYFPKEGTFTHFPTNISRDEKVVARANQDLELKVVRTHSVAKKETFRDIVQGGYQEDVLEFLRTANLLKGEKGFAFYDMLWMLKDKSFFLKVVKILKERYIFSNDVWAYSLYHRGDEEALSDFLEHNKSNEIVSSLGMSFRSKLINKVPEENEFKHRDYYPMINSRFHQLDSASQQVSLNKNFKSTYEEFLSIMVQQAEQTIANKLVFIYYLQLQDRIQEALALFKTIDLKQFQHQMDDSNVLQMQYDYMNAYFDFYTGAAEGFKVARSIVRKYEDYPIISWRVLFLEILDQLNEFDGEEDNDLQVDAETQSEEVKKQNYKKSIKKEPTLNAEVCNKDFKIELESANIQSVTIKFYLIDVEILFSRTPFLKDKTEEFSYVKPCFVLEKELVPLTATELQLSQIQRVDIEIPENLRTQNMVIEINGKGIQLFKSYYSSQLKLTIIESYGELKVTDLKGKPLPKVYVKVFSQKKNQGVETATFFKDGYTDIRGKFEFAQANGNKLKEVQKFAILVLSDELGSAIKNCKPPQSENVNTDNAAGDVVMHQAKFDRIMKSQQNKKVAK